MKPEQATALRKPFPASAIGKLPKGGAQLDYVGHAATTDRLLSVDPEWTWEPFALDEQGLPAFQGRNLWIRLTVCGVTRPGVGDGASIKEAIGDAIRNAAMRFGVALDLWSKEELESSEAPLPPLQQQRRQQAKPPSVQGETGELRTEAQSKKLFALLREAGIGDRDAALAYVADVVGHQVESTKDLTKSEAGRVIDELERESQPPYPTDQA